MSDYVFPSEKQELLMTAKHRKTPFSNYKSAALPTELCRHFPRKITVNLSSASAFHTDSAIFIARVARQSARCDRLSGESFLRPTFDRRGTIHQFRRLADG